MFLAEGFTQFAFNMLCSGTPDIVTHSHIAERFDPHESRFALVCDESRADRAFATTDIDNLTLGIMKLVYTFEGRGILDLGLCKWIRLAKRHNAPPGQVMIDANHKVAYPLVKRLEGVIDGDSVSKNGDRDGN